MASHLSKRHRMRDVTSDISIHVERGEAVALLGPNGAGKTTLFQMIAGILMPDSGSILLDGEDVTFMPIHERARRGLNYLPQEPSLFRSLTVEQNILIVIEAYEVDAVRRQRFADRLLERFGLEHVRRASAGRISGGERRRCEIARTLAARPVFVLFDEPFAGIDPIAIEEIRAAIRYLTGHGLGVLITDHSVEETLAMGFSRLCRRSGRVVCEGSPERIFNHSGVRALYLEDRTEFEP
ncbi:MAG: LPS export ABC transporter ATP-binding protein [Hyphomicrobiales bacterium]